MSGFYQSRIMLHLKCSLREAAFVEAWMLCDRPTLDGLSAKAFAHEAALAMVCVAATPDSENVALAESFGIPVPRPTNDEVMVMLAASVGGAS